MINFYHCSNPNCRKSIYDMQVYRCADCNKLFCGTCADKHDCKNVVKPRIMVPEGVTEFHGNERAEKVPGIMKCDKDRNCNCCGRLIKKFEDVYPSIETDKKTGSPRRKIYCPDCYFKQDRKDKIHDPVDLIFDEQKEIPISDAKRILPRTKNAISKFKNCINCGRPYLPACNRQLKCKPDCMEIKRLVKSRKNKLALSDQ